MAVRQIVSKEYKELLDSLKTRVASSRYKAALSVNKELILLYHTIGSQILEAQSKQGWGSKIIDQLSKDLAVEFPEMKGFSTRNLKYMRKFAHEYTDSEFVQQVVAQLPWGHNVILMDRCSDRQIRIFYIKEAIENGWSRNILDMQIETNLYKRQGAAVSNYKDKLPSPQSDLAHYTLNLKRAAEPIKKAQCAESTAFLINFLVHRTGEYAFTKKFIKNTLYSAP